MVGRPPAVVVLAVLLATAGCSGLAPGSGGPPTESLTPAPVPAGSADYPPGVTAEGVVNPERLALAHDQVLENRSYRLRSNRSTYFIDDSVRSRIDLDLRLDRNRTYLAAVETAGPRGPVILGRPPARARYWANGTLYASRITRDGEVTYSLTRADQSPFATWQYWSGTAAFGGESNYRASRYEAIFQAIPTRVVGNRTVDGTTVYVLEGRRPSDSGFTAGPADAVGPSGPGPALRATVTEDGLVRSLHLRYRAYHDGDEYDVDWRISYRALGNVTVGEPPWLDRAVSADRERRRSAIV
ncbi:DUF7537 family lipoprotein [Haloglomus litoreum]|uniref:DUF7537 family lipoprotein n=1 Tax=Haloglomus litoreum TaxID=3034026 RepID=UPI0023E811C9|nr:hypothetical protein [Haloglomus sp. DT116]